MRHLDTTDVRNDCDDARMTVEQIVARIRWLDAVLTDLQGELVAAANPDDPRSATTCRIH